MIQEFYGKRSKKKTKQGKTKEDNEAETIESSPVLTRAEKLKNFTDKIDKLQNKQIQQQDTNKDQPLFIQNVMPQNMIKKEASNKTVGAPRDEPSDHQPQATFGQSSQINEKQIMSTPSSPLYTVKNLPASTPSLNNIDQLKANILNQKDLSSNFNFSKPAQSSSNHRNDTSQNLLLKDDESVIQLRREDIDATPREDFGIFVDDRDGQDADLKVKKSLNGGKQESKEPSKVKLNKNLEIKDANELRKDSLKLKKENIQDGKRKSASLERFSRVGPQQKDLIEQKQNSKIQRSLTAKKPPKNFSNKSPNGNNQNLNTSTKSQKNFKNRNEDNQCDDSQSCTYSNESKTLEAQNKNGNTVGSDNSEDIDKSEESSQGSLQLNEITKPGLLGDNNRQRHQSFKETKSMELRKQTILQKIGSANLDKLNAAQIKRRISKKLKKQKTNQQSFKNHQSLFDSLTEVTDIETRYPVVSVIITYDSERAISLVKISDRKYAIQQYDLTTKDYDMISEEFIGGACNSFIKVKEVEQNSTGTQFSVAYFDNGQFRLRVFEKTDKSPKDFAFTEVDINKELGIDNRTMIIENLDEPYIASAFLNSNIIFVALFHNKSMMHYHFMYNIEKRKVFKVRQRVMDQKPLNFPVKVFYSDVPILTDDPSKTVLKNQVYIFYRHGQAFTINVKNLCCTEPDYKRRDSLAQLIEQQELDHLRKVKKSHRDRTKIEILTSIGGSDVEEEDVFNPDQEKNIDNMYYKFEKITDRELGQMYLIYNKALVVRTSDSIMFFRQIYDNEKRSYFWKSYHQINLQGAIYFIKGNWRIQITTDEKIYVYTIDYETLEPTLENVMFNLMECDQMIFGSKRRFCFTYRKNEANFEIRTRKYNNNFRIQLDNNSFENPIGISISSAEVFIVSNNNCIYVYDSNKFHKIQDYKLDPELFDSDTKECNQILSMSMDESEKYLAVLAGKSLILKEKQPIQLYIYKINNLKENDTQPLFKLHKYLDIKDRKYFLQTVSTQFYFQLKPDGGAKDTLLFARQDRIFSLNFETGATETVCSFDNQLIRNPEFFLPNDTQTALVVASEDEGLFVNIETNQLIDLDEKFRISNIQQIIYDVDDHVFYILSNKFKKVKGLYLIRFDEQNPEEFTFLIKVKNKLDIGDASIVVMRDLHKQYKELVVSFKQININTFNMIIIDISQLQQSNQQIQRVIFKTQTFQLWESKIKGFLINHTKDFITVSNDGIHVMALGQIQKRTFRANKMSNQLHSLEFVNFLKIDPNNCISFDLKGDITIIQIENQYMKQVGKEQQTLYDIILKTKIHLITLRELILIESINNCRTEGDIQNLLRNQPNASMFYKSFLELNGANMVSILAFDSRCMKVLLDEKTNKDYFQVEFPIFYKNKLQKSNSKTKYFYQSAIDVAYKHSQIVAIELIIQYIIKYQNKYTSAFLFFKNMTKLMKKGVELSQLLGSDIFHYKIKFDEWPGIHFNSQSLIMPYNGSIFEIRQSYNKVFGSDDFQKMQDMKNNLDIDKIQENIEDLIMGGSEDQDKKVYKTIYTVNLLPMSSMFAQIKDDDQEAFADEDESNKKPRFDLIQEKQNLVSMLALTDNLSVFEQTSILELLEFKWNRFGQNWHIVGFIMHIIYGYTITIYVRRLYVFRTTEQGKFWFLFIMMLGIAYPFCYDSYQLYKLGRRKYFNSFWNYIDFLFIWVGMINIILQLLFDHFTFINKVFQTLVILLAILKTFNFVRIFKNFAGIVIMLVNVVIELRIFLAFYAFIVYLFGLIFMVIGAGNERVPGKLNEEFKKAQESGEEFGPPNPEYNFIGHFWGNMLYVFRTSVGDFDFEASSYLTQEENWLFFVCWVIVTAMSMIVFLNFIISEIGSIYNKYYQKLDKLIQKEKANMIEEAEQLMPQRFKNDQWFPKIIIKRQVLHNS